MLNLEEPQMIGISLSGKVDMICQVGSSVGKGIDEVHPSKWEASEESYGTLDNGE